MLSGKGLLEDEGGAGDREVEHLLLGRESKATTHSFRDSDAKSVAKSDERVDGVLGVLALLICLASGSLRSSPFGGPFLLSGLTRYLAILPF